MGFALWTDGETAWAQGTHEYRPMGGAVVAAGDQFRGGDFNSGRLFRDLPESLFVGYFASLSMVNVWLRSKGRRQRARARVRAVL